jgi:hypothetical protein
VLQGLVKQFFNEKEVTSTLVMDALYSGCRQLEEAGRFLEQVCVWGGGGGRLAAGDDWPAHQQQHLNHMVQQEQQQEQLL